MKAIKLYNIQWILPTELTDEEKKEVLNNLPTTLGFKLEDEIEYLEKTPALLEKKFGNKYNCRVDSFSHVEFHIIDNLDELLRFCGGAQKKDKPLYGANGNLAAFGKTCKEKLEFYISQRINMERQGKKDEDMPKLLNQVMLSMETITGLDWYKATPAQMMGIIDRKIRDKKAVNLKSAFELDDEDVDDEKFNEGEE